MEGSGLDWRRAFDRSMSADENVTDSHNEHGTDAAAR
jgi:hypothetical protein